MTRNIVLPVEIINKIFLFMSSPTSKIIKESRVHDEPFPFLGLKSNVPAFPFPTRTQMEYRRIYRKLDQNRVHDETCENGIGYRRFHEHMNHDKSLEDIDHDSDFEIQTDSEIIDNHFMLFIFRHRFWYDRHQQVISGTYDHYMENRHLYETNPWLFRKTFQEYEAYDF